MKDLSTESTQEKTYAVLFFLWSNPKKTQRVNMVDTNMKRIFDGLAKKIEFDDLTMGPNNLLYAQVYSTDNAEDLLEIMPKINQYYGEDIKKIKKLYRDEIDDVGGFKVKFFFWNVTDDRPYRAGRKKLYPTTSGKNKKLSNDELRKLRVI